MNLNLSEILRDYSSLRADLSLPQMTAAAVICHSCDVAAEADVRTAIATFHPAGGWLTCTNRNVWLDAGAASLPDSADTGPVLEGELSSFDGLRALQIRHLGRQWRLTTIEHDATGNTALVDELTLLGKPPAPEVMRYRRYWRLTDSQTLQPFLAMLLPEARS